MSTVRRALEFCVALRSRSPDKLCKAWGVSLARHFGLSVFVTLVFLQTTRAQTSENSVGISQLETMVVRATLNTVDKGDLFIQRSADGNFLVKTEDLKSMGFTNPSGPITLADNTPYLALRAMPGVSFSFDERLLSLAITARAELLTETSFNLGVGRRTRGIASLDRSVFFNYSLDYAGGYSAAEGKANATAETGWRFGDYLFTTNATTQRTDGSRQPTRLMTSITQDDRENLLRIVAGDFFTVSQGLGSAVNMAGLSISKRFGLDPYFVRNPLQNIRGIAATPSQLELYVDGQRIRSEKVQPGSFELRDILANGGATSAQIILRDAFGQTQQFEYSFYYSDQPLAQGLHDYSYSLGVLRENYGFRSNDYGSTAFSAFHRYGVTSEITLGGFAEGSRSLLHAGPSATVVLGSAGILNLTLAASNSAGAIGKAAVANYSFQSRRWSIGIALRREAGSYATLGNPVTLSNRKYDATLSAGYNVPGAGSVSLSYAAAASYAAPDTASGQLASAASSQESRVTSLSYSIPLFSGQSSLTMRLSRVNQNQMNRTDAFIGLNYNFDSNYSVATNIRTDQTGSSESFQFTRNQPVGEGIGFTVSGDRVNGNLTSAQSRVQYNTAAAIVSGNVTNTYRQGPSTRGFNLSVAGGVGYAGGLIGFGRPITDSFGIVKVASLPDVDVSVNGQTVGKTDSRGVLFVSALSAYYDSDVTISSASVPLDYSVPFIKLRVSPSLRSGTVINFETTRLQAFTGFIQIEEQGKRRPLEFIEGTLTVEGKPVLLQTGRRGEFYLDSLKPGTFETTISVNGKPCRITLNIPESTETFVELGEVECRPLP